MNKWVGYLSVVMVGIAGFLLGHAITFKGEAALTDVQATLMVGFLGGAIALSAVCVAMWAILAQQHSAKAQHTIAHLADVAGDKDIIAAKKTFVEKAKEPAGLAPYAAESEEGGAVERDICTVLNSYELVSLGIQTGIIDCEIFKRWNRSTVLFIWAAAAPFVTEMRKRKKSPTLWFEFEEMAREFDMNKRPRRRF